MQLWLQHMPYSMLYNMQRCYAAPEYNMLYNITCYMATPFYNTIYTMKKTHAIFNTI